MATGVPSNNGTGRSNRSRGHAVSLEYPGKQPESEILAGPQAQLQEVARGAADSPNRVIYGENLEVLRSLTDEKSVKGRVKLVYIDPPYATGGRFHSRKLEHAYVDDMAGAEYLEFLRQRLILLRELMSDDGSIYVHLDGNMAFHVKVIMDEVFGASNFRNWITRRKGNRKNYTRKTFGNIVDFILFYTKSDSYVWNRQLEPLSEQTARNEYRYVEEETGRRYMKVPVHAPGVRKGETGQPWRGMNPPPGKHWQYPPSTLEEMDARGEIYWSSNGNPRRKVYLDEHKGAPVQDVWWDFKDAHNQNIRITGYPTEKNPDLIRRIVAASTNPGDLVLDAFGGSGTTADVANQEGRMWITVDNSPLAIRTTIHRLAHGLQPMGDYVSDVQDTEQKSLFPRGDEPVQYALQVQKEYAAGLSKSEFEALRSLVELDSV